MLKIIYAIKFLDEIDSNLEEVEKSYGSRPVAPFEDLSDEEPLAQVPSNSLVSRKRHEIQFNYLKWSTFGHFRVGHFRYNLCSV